MPGAEGATANDRGAQTLVRCMGPFYIFPTSIFFSIITN
jgi:hypothetical protein